jgi:hypothetical protein
LSEEMTVGRLMDLLKHEHPEAIVRIIDHGDWRLDEVFGRWRPWEIEGGEPDMTAAPRPEDLKVLLVTDRHMNTRLVPGVGWGPLEGDDDGE